MSTFNSTGAYPLVEIPLDRVSNCVFKFPENITRAVGVAHSGTIHTINDIAPIATCEDRGDYFAACNLNY